VAYRGTKSEGGGDAKRRGDERIIAQGVSGGLRKKKNPCLNGGLPKIFEIKQGMWVAFSDAGKLRKTCPMDCVLVARFMMALPVGRADNKMEKTATAYVLTWCDRSCHV